MSKTCIKPFWRYDVVKTEQWLTDMQVNGYALRKVWFGLGVFSFDKTASRRMLYRIVYQKNGREDGFPSLKDMQLNPVCGSRRYLIVNRLASVPGDLPSYRNLLAKNVRLKQTIMLVILLLLFLLLFPNIILGYWLLFHASVALGNLLPVLQFTYIAAIICVAAVIIWCTGAYIVLDKGNARLEKLCGTQPISVYRPNLPVMNKQQEAELARAGRLIRQFKFAWQYAPDKTAAWLERMAAQGYRLLRIGFYFVFEISSPQTIRFHIDYPKKADAAYFNDNSDNGWKLFHPSAYLMSGMCLWGQDYTDDPPEFYSDSTSKIKQAKRVVNLNIYFHIALIVAVVMYIYYLSTHADIMLIPISLLLLLFLLLHGYYAVQIILYYIRVRKGLRQPKAKLNSPS